MTSKVILSYRRSDSDVITGRVRDKLASYYGEDAVFMDIDSIRLGFDYRKQIKEALLNNKILLAVIGPKWLGGRGKDSRIKEENDPVRIELETALQHGMPVIPVLVGGATIPKASELPTSLQDLCYLQAAVVDGGQDFHLHMERLIHAMDRILQPPEAPHAEPAAPAEVGPPPLPAPKSRKWLAPAVAIAACLILAALGYGAYPWLAALVRPKAITAAGQPGAPSTAGAAVPAPPVFSSAGCASDKVNFYDDFHKPDPGWDFTAGGLLHYADGQLAITPSPNRSSSTRYPSLIYENATICAHLKAPPQMKNASDTNAGVIFWSADRDNYYSAQITADGAYLVYRRIAGRWVTVVRRAKSDRINSGANAVNEMRVVLADDFGALFVNNAQIQQFRGQPPSGGGAVGLTAESETNASDEWRFLNIAVVDNGKAKAVTLPAPPSGPTLASCQPVNVTDFQDSFAKPDPEWGFADPATHYADGELMLKAKEKGTYVQLYMPLLYKNATVCATVKSPAAIADINGEASGGAVFWAIDYKNLYEAAVYPNGSFDVYRKVDDKWIAVVPRTASDLVKKGVGAVNDLAIVLNNGSGSLYINGKLAREFRGQPPDNGGAVGLLAASEAGQQDEWRYLKITAIENQ